MPADIISISVITGILLGLILLILEYRSGLFNIRPKKELSYEIVSATPIVSKSDRGDLSGRVQILFDSQPVDDVTSVVFRLTNTGNTPINPSDYERPAKMEIPNSQLLEYNISNIEPDNLHVNLSGGATAIEIAPLLLNPRESFSISALVTNYQNKVYLDARIAGAKIRELNTPRLLKSMSASFPTTIFIIAWNTLALILLVQVGYLDPSEPLGLTVIVLTIILHSTALTIFILSRLRF